MADAAVALALLQMATPQRTVARVQRNSHDSDVSSKTPSTSPERCFKVTHVKRTRDDLVTVVYSTGDESMEIPFARGESPSVFYHRREKAARILFDANRKDVYCTWRKALVSIVVQSSSWLLFKDSPQQKWVRVWLYSAGRYSVHVLPVEGSRQSVPHLPESGLAPRLPDSHLPLSRNAIAKQHGGRR